MNDVISAERVFGTLGHVAATETPRCRLLLLLEESRWEPDDRAGNTASLYQHLLDWSWLVFGLFMVFNCIKNEWTFQYLLAWEDVGFSTCVCMPVCSCVCVCSSQTQPGTEEPVELDNVSSSGWVLGTCTQTFFSIWTNNLCHSKLIKIHNWKKKYRTLSYTKNLPEH